MLSTPGSRGLRYCDIAGILCRTPSGYLLAAETHSGNRWSNPEGLVLQEVKTGFWSVPIFRQWSANYDFDELKNYSEDAV